MNNKNRIAKLEKILDGLKATLLPDRREQYESMSKAYLRKIKELKQ